MQEARRSGGRPPWIPTPDDLEKAESLAGMGMTQQQIADCLGIHASTLSEKKQDFNELNEALKRGRAKGIARVTTALLKNVDTGNVTAQIFYLKCVAGWREAKDTGIESNQTLVERLLASGRLDR